MVSFDTDPLRPHSYVLRIQRNMHMYTSYHLSSYTCLNSDMADFGMGLLGFHIYVQKSQACNHIYRYLVLFEHIFLS